MKKDFELSRRDPIAHNALINQRREEEARKLRQHVASFPQHPRTYSHPPHSTQPSRWDTHMIATGDMLLPPSTAPAAGPLFYAPLVATPSAAVSPNLDQPRIESLPDSNSKTGKGASVPAPEQIRSSSVAHRRLSKTPEFTSHDLQKHLEESITFLSKNQAPQLEEALGQAIGNLFGSGSLNVSPVNKGLVSKALQKATRKDFQAIISKKCNENKYEQMPDSLQLSYARELRSFIVQKAKTEEEHRRLAGGVRLLLDKESVNPKILLKVLGDTLRPVKLNSPTDVVAGGQMQPDNTTSGQPTQAEGQTKMATPAVKQNSSHQETGLELVGGANGRKAEMKDRVNGSKEKKGGRKRSLPADGEHASKKAKHAPAVTPNFASSKSMEKMFEDLQSREAARPSKGGS